MTTSPTSSAVVSGALFRRLLRAKERIDDAYADDLTVSDLAFVAGLSRYHFMRQFKLVFGCTPHQYLTRVRLSRAKALLSRPTASVTSTCFAVGFDSLGSFSSLFRRHVGQSPLAWHRAVAPTIQVPAGLARVYVPHCFLYGLGLR